MLDSHVLSYADFFNEKYQAIHKLHHTPNLLTSSPCTSPCFIHEGCHTLAAWCLADIHCCNKLLLNGNVHFMTGRVETFWHHACVVRVEHQAFAAVEEGFVDATLAVLALIVNLKEDKL